MQKNSFPVDVLYMTKDKQKIITIDVTENTSFKEAIIQSKIQEFVPEVDLMELKIGSFAKVVQLDDIIKEGQRIEFYFPLIADPKEMRRIRAEKAKNKS